MKSNSQGHNSVRLPQTEREIWDRFSKDRELLERLHVTTQELEALANCVLLGTLTCKQDMLFILQQIRVSTGSLSEEPTLSPIPSPRRDEKTVAKELSIPGEHRPAASVPTVADPGSLEVIARSRAIEQFGVLFWAMLLIGFIMWNFVAGLSTWRHHFLTRIGVQAYHATVSEVWDGNRFDRI
jgi:hypothetical protein